MKHAQPASGNALAQASDKPEPKVLKQVTDHYISWQIDDGRIDEGTMSEDEFTAAKASLDETERLLMATPCLDASEWIMKLMVASRGGSKEPPKKERDPHFWAEGQMFVYQSEVAAADPVVPIYRAWLSARDQVHRVEDLYHQHDHPAVLAADKIEVGYLDLLINLRPTSREGVAALMHVLWTIDGPKFRPDTEEYASEVESPAAKLMAAIWAYGSGREGLPQRCYEASLR